MTDKDMWLVYRDNAGETHHQHWNDITDVGGLIDPESGEDMAIVGWTTDDPDLGDMGKPFQFQFFDNNGEDIYLLSTFDDFFEAMRAAREMQLHDWHFDGDCASTSCDKNMTDRAGRVLTGSYAIIIR